MKSKCTSESPKECSQVKTEQNLPQFQFKRIGECTNQNLHIHNLNS